MKKRSLGTPSSGLRPPSPPPALWATSPHWGSLPCEGEGRIPLPRTGEGGAQRRVRESQHTKRHDAVYPSATMTGRYSERRFNVGVNAHSQSAAVAHRYGGHSMTVPLRSVMVRRPGKGFDWEAFGYVHPIDQERAEREHAALCETLAANGVEIVEGGPDDGLLDAIFTFDPSIMTDAGAVI